MLLLCLPSKGLCVLYFPRMELCSWCPISFQAWTLKKTDSFPTNCWTQTTSFWDMSSLDLDQATIMYSWIWVFIEIMAVSWSSLDVLSKSLDTYSQFQVKNIKWNIPPLRVMKWNLMPSWSMLPRIWTIQMATISTVCIPCTF